MRLGRFRYAGQSLFGVIDTGHDVTTITALDSDPFRPRGYHLTGNGTRDDADSIDLSGFSVATRLRSGELSLAGPPIPLDDVQLLAPVVPSKVLGYGRNYSHTHRPQDEYPEFFLKPPTAVIGPGQDVYFPKIVEFALPEPELAIVVGKRCRNIAADDYAQYVLGYTCANDLTARTEKGMFGGVPVMAKAFDTFCPLGPWIETDIDPANLALGCSVNGEVKTASSTAEMISGVADLLALSSRLMTLLPGDVVLTGTPKVVAPLVVGDSVTVWIDGIGSLTNPIVSAQG
jgi:2-keto-4-pentenoate hydratase/2-oxohepta-3-ene-1,7-dioic acid hydratase in catechol pathway